MSSKPQRDDSRRGAAYPPGWRTVVAALYAASRASLPLIAILVLFGASNQLTPPRLARLVVAFSLLPGLLAGLARRAVAVDLIPTAGRLTLVRRGLVGSDRRVEIDREQVERVEPWRVALPGPGLSIWTAPTGRRRLDLQTDDPVAVLRALGSAADSVPRAMQTPSLAYAEARRVAVKRSYWRRTLKFGLFPLLPAFIFFRLHQYIVYGGLLGQYYLEGWRPYLSSLVFHWVLALVYLVLYASVWRALAEAVSLLVARWAPERAISLRRWTERAVALAYYAGIPVLIAFTFLA